MIYRGTFKNIHEQDCEVVIQTNDGDPTVVSMDEYGDDIRLMTSPVILTTETDDMFQTVEI